MFRIKEELKKQSKSVGSLANHLDVNPNTVSRIINNTAKPSIDLLIKTSAFLNVDVRELFKPSKGGALLTGFVEYKNEVYKVYSKQDLDNLVSLVESDLNN